MALDAMKLPPMEAMTNMEPSRYSKVLDRRFHMYDAERAAAAVSAGTT